MAMGRRRLACAMAIESKGYTFVNEIGRQTPCEGSAFALLSGGQS